MPTTTPLRVLLVVDFPFPGTTGSPLHCMAIVKGLARKGCVVRVLRYEGGAGTTGTEEWEGIPVHRVARSGWRRGLRHVVAAFDPDVVYVHGWRSALLTLPARRQRPSVIELHSLTAPPSRKSRLVQRAARLATRVRRDEVIVLSDAERADYIAGRLSAADRVTRIYPPLETHESHGGADKPDDGRTILYAGNFQQYQGLSLLWDAMALLWRSRPDARLVVYGGDAQAFDAAVGSAASAHPMVHVRGRVPMAQMPVAQHEATVLVIPRPDLPINRTTPRKLGEYLAAGRLVVATDVGDTGWLLTEHRAGLVASPDAHSLAGQLAAGIDPTLDRTPYVRAALALAAAEFDPDRTIGARRDLLKAAADRRRR